MSTADAEVLGGATELALVAEARLFLSGVQVTDEGGADVAGPGQRAAAISALNHVSLASSEGRIPMNLARLRHLYLKQGIQDQHGREDH